VVVADGTQLVTRHRQSACVQAASQPSSVTCNLKITLTVVGWLHTIDCKVLSSAVCRKFHRQAEAGYCWQEGDIQWTEHNSVVYPAVSSLAGLVAGMFGVGGGIVKVWDLLLLPKTLSCVAPVCNTYLHMYNF